MAPCAQSGENVPGSGSEASAMCILTKKASCRFFDGRLSDQSVKFTRLLFFVLFVGEWPLFTDRVQHPRDLERFIQRHLRRFLETG